MTRRDRTERLAQQVADGIPLDRSTAAQATDTSTERAVFEQLAILAAARDRVAAASARPSLPPPRVRMDPAGALLALFASIRIVIGVASTMLLGFEEGGWPASALPANGAVVVVFGAAAVILLGFHRSDRRAIQLGIVFLIVASSFANGLYGSPLLHRSGVIVWLRGLPADAFLAYAFWRFVRVFPEEPSRREARGLRWAVWTAGAAGVILLLATAVDVFAPAHPFADVATHLARRSAKGTIYWTVIFGALIPALLMLARRTWTAGAETRRRGALFLAGLLLGLLPLSCNIVFETISPSYEWWSTANRSLVFNTALVFLLTIPFTTTYAVLVSRVLEVRVLIRRTLQYAFARATLMVATVLPFGFFVRDVYLHRELPLNQVFGSDRVWTSGLAVLAGIALLGARRPILALLDRLFFRSTYDTGDALARILDAARQSRTLGEACGAVSDRMMEMMGLASAGVLVARSDGALVPVGGPLPPLPADSALTMLASAVPSPLYVDLERSSALRRLPVDDLFWLADTDTRALVPVHGARGSLCGLVALGPALSEEELSDAHGPLIAALGAGLAAPLEARIDGSEEGARAADDRAAQECSHCGRIAAADAEACAACGGSLASAVLPPMLAGKFAVDRVIGRGGMGVVYRATDASLGRTVAIKTLPRVSAEQSIRLRREARTMATFAHANLATLFGLETWRGTPMLIVEYLDGGTLASRIHRAPLAWGEWLPIGSAVLDALAHIHERGVMHRDVKPSNVGFTGQGVPKLLDFGLADLVDSIVPDSGDTSDARPSAEFAILSDRRIGTPVYMSPEAARGETPGPHFDLWSFAVLMLEVLSGRMLFPTTEAAMRHLPAAALPDWRPWVPDLPADAVTLLGDALSPHPAHRPKTANEFKHRLGAGSPGTRR